MQETGSKIILEGGTLTQEDASRTDVPQNRGTTDLLVILDLRYRYLYILYVQHKGAVHYYY